MLKSKRNLLCIVLTLVIAMSTCILPLTSVSAVETTSEKYILGDVDMDGNLSIRDVTVAQKSVAKLIELNYNQLRLANCDEYDGLQISDATYIQLKVAEVEADYPKNCEGLVVGKDYIDISQTIPTEPTTVPMTTKKIKVGLSEYEHNSIQYEGVERYGLSYTATNGSYLSFGTTDLKYLGYTEKQAVGVDYWGNYPVEFYMYEAEIPVGSTSYKFYMNDIYYSEEGDAVNSNSVYAFFYYNGDPCHAGYHNVYINDVD